MNAGIGLIDYLISAHADAGQATMLHMLNPTFCPAIAGLFVEYRLQFSAELVFVHDSRGH